MTVLAQVAAQPDLKLTAQCARPFDLRGYQSISGGEVERIWGVDRDALADCANRHDATVKFYAERDAALAGSK